MILFFRSVRPFVRTRPFVFFGFIFQFQIPIHSRARAGGTRKTEFTAARPLAIV